jgi:hypothetical protein
MKDEILKHFIGVVIAATLGWSAWVTTSVYEDRSRLARIETKVDLLLDNWQESKK